MSMFGKNSHCNEKDAYFIVHLDLFLNNHYYVLSLLSFVVIIYHRLLIKHNLE